MASDWFVHAGRLLGDGTIDIIETDLPIAINSIDRNLSAPTGMSASLENKIKRLKNNGRPIFERWNSVLVVETADLIRGLGVYADPPSYGGATWSMDLIGLSGYPIDMPYINERTISNEDPLDTYRHIWAHLQNQPGGNVGVTIDSLTSPVRIGTTEDPRKLSWWETTDLGAEIDKLASETPFDWLETVYWREDIPDCHIRLGYPTIGGRRDSLRLVLGENLATTPGVSEAEYLNEAHVLGAGEGRKRVRGYSGVTDGRVRRAKVFLDESRKNDRQANSLAYTELHARRGQFTVDQVEVFDHANAPLDAIELGDSIRLYAETEHALVDQYVRVVGRSESPQRGDRAVLTIVSEEV